MLTLLRLLLLSEPTLGMRSMCSMTRIGFAPLMDAVEAAL